MLIVCKQIIKDDTVCENFIRNNLISELDQFLIILARVGPGLNTELKSFTFRNGPGQDSFPSGSRGKFCLIADI